MSNDNFPKRTYAEITDSTDTYEVLAHARKQAQKRKFDDVFIVDVDAHIGDSQAWADVLSFIENPVVRANAFGFGPVASIVTSKPDAGSAIPSPRAAFM